VADADQILARVATTNQLRAYIGAVYLNEMRIALKQVVANLTFNGDMIMVVAPSRFSGYAFDTPSYLTRIAHDEGLTRIANVPDVIRSRRLVTSRWGKARPIGEEHIMHFRRY